MASASLAWAYSYLRFSSPQQAKGDSIRRQTQNREAWLAAHPRVRLDTSLKLTDSGRSAFRRKNWDTYALARFVDCIKSGRVQPGSYLLVENLDRLSREDAGEATELFLSIVNKGIIVVQLSPVVMEFRRPVDMQSLMFAIVELSRGHSESAIKSERGRAFWARKQREAATRIVTRILPGWIRYADGKLVLDPERAAVMRRMFAMAREGHGVQAIARTLNGERVPTFGRATVWSTTTVWHFLRSRAAIGEYVPYGRRKRDDAPPAVPNYYPAVVDPDTYHAVQAAIATRARVGRGRRGKHVNLFAGMLRDARDGGTLSYWHNGQHPAVLIPVNAKEGKGVKWTSFPAGPFEDAILPKLVEVKPSEVEGGDDAGRKVEVLTGRRDELDKLIRVWTAKMDNPDIADTVEAKLAEYNTRRRQIVAELAEAQREAASPASEAWGEFRTLADLLKKDPSDEMRTRVRAALRRSIESITCLFVPRGRTRLAAVRVQFAGSELHRDYLFIYKMPWRSVIRGKVIERPASLSVESPKNAWADTADDLDLRDPKQAAALAVDLEADDPPEPTGNPTNEAAPQEGRRLSGRHVARRAPHRRRAKM